MKNCDLCSNKSQYRCSNCKIRNYCSKDCQKYDWNQKNHKSVCNVLNNNLKIGIFIDDAILQFKILNSVFKQAVLEVKKGELSSKNPLNLSRFVIKFKSFQELDLSINQLNVKTLDNRINDYFLVPILNNIWKKNQILKISQDLDAKIVLFVAQTWPGKIPPKWMKNGEFSQTEYELSASPIQTQGSNVDDNLWTWAVDIPENLDVHKNVVARSITIKSYIVK